MKKILLAIIAINVIVTACQNPFVSDPYVPGETEGRSSGIPGGITATHGGKRSIELSWGEVSGAARYHVFKADSPLMPFIQCGETTDTRLEFSVPAGSTVYYRVSAVSHNGQESERSFYVKGSSLAQPIITDITDITEASATVTWYMENVADDTYKASLRYTVYCFNGTTEVAQIPIDGSKITANKATFTGLFAGAEYTYQVEAFLVSDQSSSEKSEIVNAETARRMRPGAPEELTASQGTSPNTITLTFKLPEMVSIKVNDGEYEDHGLKFVISKRFYIEGVNNNDYMQVDTFDPDEYEFGKMVAWTDTKTALNDIIRGRDYEYIVQSYVNIPDKTITADTSKSLPVRGWTLNEGRLSIGDPEYTLNTEETMYETALLPLHFTFNTKGKEYRYRVLETINPIGDEYALDPEGEINRSSALLSYEEITEPYTASMNLTLKSTANSPGRGLYSYTVSIHLLDGTEIDTVTAVGDVLISEDIDPIVVEGFAVEDGYANKFLLTWDSADNTKYILYESADGIHWDEVDTFNDDASPEDDGTPDPIIVELENYDPGVTVYFAMQPIRMVQNNFGHIVAKKGQRVYLEEGAQTLGEPELLSATGSYSTITAAWKKAQKADTYRINYRYVGESNYTTIATLLDKDLTPDETGTLHRSFEIPGYNNAIQSGMPLEIKVEALNEKLREVVNGAEGDPSFFNTSQKKDTQLIGPAGLDVQTSKAAVANYIDVSWNKVAGAGGYYVFRRQFNMNNTAEEREAIVYYVSAHETAPIVKGKDLTKVGPDAIIEDTIIVKASASFTNPRYTLRDEYMNDGEYGTVYGTHIETYRNQQNDMVRGNPYRYYVVPVLSELPMVSLIEFNYAQDSMTNKNTTINSYTITVDGVSIPYSNAAGLEKTGFTFGFGQNVTATKGTYTSNLNPANGFINNDGIKVTWEAPPLLAGVENFTPRYTVYRKAYNESAWASVRTIDPPLELENLEYIGDTESEGIVYEYLIGIANGNATVIQPGTTPRYIDWCKEQKDSGRPKMQGYILDKVKIQNVSRNELKVENEFAEEVKWSSSRVKYNDNIVDYNWGIDGYTVFVMNRNIDGNWHDIYNIESNIPNQLEQSTKVTNANGLLKVLRDYKHYFKVRSYVYNDGGDKVYSPDPNWDYEALFSLSPNRNNQDRADFLQDDYVKWGARQITPEEFSRIATLFITVGINNTIGVTSNSYQLKSVSWITKSNNGASGRVSAETTNAARRLYVYFDNFKPDLYTNANRGNSNYATTFVKIHGSSDTYANNNIYADIDVAGAFPSSYGTARYYDAGKFRYYEYGTGYCDVIGPDCVSPLYTGKIRFNDTGDYNNTANDLKWSDGYIDIQYPVGTRKIISGGGQTNTPLPFRSQANGYLSSTESDRTKNDEWY